MFQEQNFNQEKQKTGSEWKKFSPKVINLKEATQLIKERNQMTYKDKEEAMIPSSEEKFKLENRIKKSFFDRYFRKN